MIGNQTLGPTTFGQQNVVDPSVPTLASANTIAPSAHVTRLTGSTVVKTITPPNAYFNGPLFLYNSDSGGGTWDATGNIAVAGTMTQYVLFGFIYDPSVSKWYPTAVA